MNQYTTFNGQPALVLSPEPFHCIGQSWVEVLMLAGILKGETITVPALTFYN